MPFVKLRINDERAIHLHLVELKLPEESNRGMTGPKVVQRYTEAK